MSKKRRNKTKRPQNPYMKQIKDLFIVSGYYVTYTFFKIGNKRYIHCSRDGEQVFLIIDLEKKEIEFSETFSKLEVVEALEVKRSSKLSNNEHYQVPLNEDDFDEFYEEQDRNLSQEEYWMVQMSLLSENSLERFGVPEESHEFMYDYFGEPIAYGETDRQWIDYHMSQGNFDAAYEIHRAYIKEK